MAIVCAAPLAAGCGPDRLARMVPPPLDPLAVSTAAVNAADADQDGLLGPEELRHVPALAMAIGQLDADGDGKLSAPELRDWLEAVRTSRVAITAFITTVTQRGRPLQGVTVRLVPEPFMGDAARQAEAVTDAEGNASPAMRDSTYAGVNCGLYRVVIVGKGIDGELLPARYNTASTLGVAVGGPLPEKGVVAFSLE